MKLKNILDVIIPKKTLRNNKTIFLDLDGVLNRSHNIEMRQGKYYPRLDKDLIEIFNKINFDFNLILHSTWREELEIEELNDFFIDLGLKHKVSNLTNPKKEKVLSLKEYIKENKIKFFLIIDDDKEILSNFNIENTINTYYGLSEENIKEIKRKFDDMVM